MIIDEKGRLFGKINIIDFSIILILFFLIPMFYFVYKIKNIKIQGPEREIVEIELPCNLIKLPPETLKLITLGDKEFDIAGNKIAEISWIGESKVYQYKFYLYPNNQRDFIMKDAEGLNEIPVKLKLKAEVKDNGLYHKDKRIIYDSSFEFRTDKYKAIAVPLTPGYPRKEQWLKVKVKFSALSPELSGIINQGHTEKDEYGRIVGKLEEILNRKSSEIQALKVEENKVIFINDPYRSDVTALLNLLCSNINGEFYFKNYPMKIGSQINFTSDLYIISGIIVDIKQ
ncbi:MAG: DUF4330 domain-containing protein [Candidatus Omnitrophica bacterium]|nr:DUF4330 domain-containing protein [Candidatus Omnitrophota bacterium]MDD5237753.1 DUF4330 domain-containing protein [Candidatus Omnitrophota bacterium]